jgi:hypothetical protein
MTFTKNVYEHLEFPMVGENIYGSRTATNKKGTAEKGEDV